jgi:hypothetical protein
VINTLINPPGIEDEYLNCLNACFPGWGDRRTFDWYFHQTPADLMIFQKEGQTAAGSAITYRRVTLPNGNSIKSGIMTGSWTLPHFRRQGFFARTIDESVRLASQRDAALLLAFVTESNPSFRGLVSAGAALVPTSYLYSTKETPPVETTEKFHRVNNDKKITQAIWEQVEQRNQSHCRFAYADATEFEAQFLHRPTGLTQIFQTDAGCFALVEIKQNVEQLHLFLASHDPNETRLAAGLGWFLNRALTNNRQFFMFSTDERIGEAARKIGLEQKAGHLTMLVANSRTLAEALVVPGQELLSSKALEQPTIAPLVGTWSIAGAERA